MELGIGCGGWRKKGSYVLKQIIGIALILSIIKCGAAAALPVAKSLSPSHGNSRSNEEVVFSSQFMDVEGWEDIQECGLLINYSVGVESGLYVRYERQTDKIYLQSEDGRRWLGGYRPGSPEVIENSLGRIDCGKTVVAGSKGTLSVKWAISFKSAFSGAKVRKVYLGAKDKSSGSFSWVEKGTWLVGEDEVPSTGAADFSALSPQANEEITITAEYKDKNGWQDLLAVYMLVETSDRKNCFYVAYNQNTNKIYLREDGGDKWLGGYAPGGKYYIENAVVKVNCQGSSVAASETGLTLSWKVAFKEGFTGLQKVFLYARDDSQRSSGWVEAGQGEVRAGGAVVGASGGEVNSGDELAKLEIPEGALSQEIRISVEAVDKEGYKSKAPAEKEVLSVVECKPAGLVFEKPVQLVYNLGQVEVPGTEVVLGLYNEEEGRITLTGESCEVGTDGYTVRFPIKHFSAYVALKSLTAQDAPIGAGVKIPLPDLFTGSFSYSIPLSVAGGRKQMQPSLGLSYHSGNGNSWVGYGFSLNPGYIVRSTRLGPAKYNDQEDIFYFISDGGATELVYLTGNVYEAKIESSFSRFYKESDDTWRVISKEGQTLIFGGAAEGKERSGSGTYSWYLTQAVDNNGNYMTYSYTQDEGKSYLSRIEYTGHSSGVAPANAVEFYLEARGDVFSSYLSTSKIATAKRLREIWVKVNNELVWRYELDYEYSADTGRSLLVAVKQYNRDGQSLPEKKLIYQKSR